MTDIASANCPSLANCPASPWKAGRNGGRRAVEPLGARQVEERFGRLQDGRAHARIAGTGIAPDQRFRARIQRRSCLCPAHPVPGRQFTFDLPLFSFEGGP